MLPNMCCFPSRDDSKDGGVSEAFSKEVAPIGFHRNDQPFRFLDLPIDLRVMVYSHVLAWPKFTRLRHYGKCESSNFWLAHTGNSVPLCPYDKRPVWPPERTSPAILRVCRQIKHEALGELLKTPLVFDHVLPFLTNIFGCKSAIPRYLTSYISPPLICKARRVVISIGGSPNSSSYDHWHGWVHFLTYLWFSWRESPPPLEHIMVRITKLPPENYDRSSENEFPTIDKSDITRSQQLLLMLAGLLTTVPKACDVEIKANTSYEVYIRQKVCLSQTF
ncbi:hypothetical protein P154DRAFT_109201 [Amniculicola lignicola CBS 123094]|uniref:2EXR domain-containing protein n=1 Tax=Amniculicola lignicola CBS 123094 TaxID=1392246 RepID=A0A6A5WS71_9PLEO|nr:hypothetical protein P154DRAFT_109201 [Amniculicola lignicola CBS 123094]